VSEAARRNADSPNAAALPPERPLGGSGGGRARNTPGRHPQPFSPPRPPVPRPALAACDAGEKRRPRGRTSQ